MFSPARAMSMESLHRFQFHSSKNTGVGDFLAVVNRSRNNYCLICRFILWYFPSNEHLFQVDMSLKNWIFYFKHLQMVKWIIIIPTVWKEPVIVLVKWVKLLSRVRPFATPWTVANQAPLSMGFSRQQYRKWDNNCTLNLQCSFLAIPAYWWL